MVNSGWGFPAIAVRVPAGVERDAIVGDATKQIEAIGDAIAGLAPKDATKPSEPPPGDDEVDEG